MLIDDFKKYEQLYTPDNAALADCLNEAKGPKRTMAQFALDTGISPATLSRILNMNFKKPLSKELIIRIFEHRANQEDSRLLRKFAVANGLVSASNVGRNLRNGTSHEYMQYLRRKRRDISTAIKNSILASILVSSQF